MTKLVRFASPLSLMQQFLVAAVHPSSAGTVLCQLDEIGSVQWCDRICHSMYSVVSSSYVHSKVVINPGRRQIAVCNVSVDVK